MKRFFDPSLIARAYRDPLAWASLSVDLLPLLAIVTLGWGPTALVALYWLENLLIGGFTLLRMVASGFGNVLNFALAVFLVPFFIVHYGMFCVGHGTFLMAFATQNSTGSTSLSVGNLVDWAISTGPHMLWFLAAIAAVGFAFFVRDFWLNGDYKRTDISALMFSPYGRIVTLHVAILLGAFLTFGLGQPMLGVLLLILIRVTFGVALSVTRRLKRDQTLAAPPAPVAQS